MSSSSWMMPMPGTGSAMTFRLGLSSAVGSSTSRRSPAVTRSDLPTGAWLSWTSPAWARSAALVRETPNSRASAASTRSPSRPSGTYRVRASGMGGVLTCGGAAFVGGLGGAGPAPALVLGLATGLVAAGALAVDGDAAQREDADQHGRADDGDVGDVADEQTEVVDEVDDV